MRGLVQLVPAADWTGPASMTFASLLDQQPAAYTRAAQAMSSAASALRSHAAVLEAARQDADDAVRLDVAAAHATLRWLCTGSPSEPRLAGSPGDPGRTARQQALDQVALATRRARESAASTATCLRHAAHQAPERPGFAERAARSVGGFVRDVELGTTETVTSAASLALRLDPGRLVRDPVGYTGDVATTGAGVAHVVSRPEELAAAVADVDTWRESRGRWVGHLLPDVLLGLTTAGAAPVAERSATTAVRVAGRIGPKDVRHALTQALDVQAGTGRSPLRLRDVRPHLTQPDVAGYRTPVSAVDTAVGRRVARDSRWAERLITPRVQQAAAELRSSLLTDGAVVHLQGLDNAVKGQDSLLRKLVTESAPGQPAAQLAPGLNDTVRYTVTVPDDRYVKGAVDAVTAVERQGPRLTAAKNSWGGERYQGLNLTFHDPLTGRPFELQVHTPDSWRATVDTHGDYEWFRSEGVDPALRADYARRIAARFALVPRPDDVDRLTDLLRPLTGPARMTTPELASLPDVGRGLRLSAGVHGAHSLPCDDDQ
jgi:hypothetical protein